VADIYFVRHGQASFGQQNYDELSELGHEQAKAVGKSLALFCQPHLFVSGSLKRQKQTLDNVLSEFDRSGLAGANTAVMEAFNEFDHDNVLNVVYPEYADRSKMVADLMKEADPKKAFHKLYQKAVTRWLQGDGEFNESFHAFEQRVEGGLQQLIDQSEKGQTILVVSSAGPIAMCMKRVLGAPVEHAFQLNEVMANTAVSRIMFNEQGDSNLSFFNSYQHLPLNKIKVTYR